GLDGIARDETAIELTYSAQVTSWMSLQGDVQFLLNPAKNPNSGTRETAVVVGLRAKIDF
ncbi:MAG TPA: carbohydrate porin, partial [Clostridia bacterium]|nr:carbohydrate porin [Clostridia bacterium]